jgi:hypothetical protein
LTNLEYKHEIRLFPDMAKDAFPHSHTCFFQLDIPNCQTDEMCYNRLSAAAEMCGVIDEDTRDVAEESE